MMNMVLQTIGLTKQYGTQFAVHDVNLNVEQGKIYGLLGRNGAGKTTTIRMVTGLLKPTSGEVILFGEKMKAPTKKVFGRIGALIESPAFYENLTAKENLKIIMDLRGTQSKNSIEDALQTVNLEKETKKKVKQYSLGMKQRLGIAMAMMHNPEFIILDEPTNGLDPIGIQQIRLLIKKLSVENGVTVLISSHILSEVEQMADKVGIIDQGVLVEELTMEEIRHRNRHYVKMTVSDMNRTIPILEKELAISNFEILNDNEIKIFQVDGNLENINRVLVKSGIGVSELSVKKGNLEEYFLKLTGGVSIG
ncbi:MAG TPA: ABC transporter ATP-binding protein [Lachnospiraceae bacterium]|nr:ABC transporter ATP-binding protein [Lachnospiraceae bacterium]